MKAFDRLLPCRGLGAAGRPEYAKLIADNPIELPLDTTKMVVAFRMWDQLVGAKRAR